MNLDGISPSSALKEVFKLFQIRSIERRALLAEEVSDVRDTFSEHNEFFIAALNKLANQVKDLRRQVEATKTNDLETLLGDILTELRDHHDRISDLREQNRHNRIAFSKVTTTRQSHTYHERRMLKFTRDEEQQAIKAFYGLVSDQFGSDDLGYRHALHHGLSSLEMKILTIEHRTKKRSGYGFAEVTDDLSELLEVLVSLRESCQISHAEVARAYEIIRLSLLDR